MSRKALGRGLSALLGEETESPAGEDFLEVEIDLIIPNPEQPRTRFTEENLEDLAQSIRSNGIIQPIVLRRKGTKFELVAGERRWRAAQRIGLQKIPAIIKEVSDEKLLELALVENIQRQELNAIEEAKAYRKLIDSVGLTQEMIAERVGKGRTIITTFLRFLKLPDDIQNLVEEEKITAGHARALLLSDNTDLQRKVAKSIMELTLSVRETERAIKKLARGNSHLLEKKAVKPTLDANMKAAETKMKRYFGTNVRILPNGKGTGGKIELEYYGDDDLNRIYELMVKIKI